VPQNHALNRQELSVFENSQIADIDFVYGILKDVNNNAVAIMYFQILNFGVQHYQQPSKATFASRFLNFFVSKIKPRILIAGNLFRHDSSSIVWKQEKFSALDIFKIYKLSIDALCSHFCTAGVFIKDTDARLVPCLINHAPDLKSLPNDISMELEIPENWQVFEDYEKSLKHKYQQRARKVRKAFANLDVKELTEQDIEKHQKELYQLYQQVTFKQSIYMGVLSPTFLQEFKKVKQDNFKVYGFFFQENLVAFSSVIVQNNEWDMFYIGFDYNLNNKLQLYFNILFHALECSLQQKQRHLIMGRTALEAKAILGCQPHYMHNFFRVQNRIIRWAMNTLSGRFSATHGENWQNRHPFKREIYESMGIHILHKQDD
jgi:hypothetical protein